MQEILPILFTCHKHTTQQYECTYLAYSEEILSSCLESIKSGTLSLNKASKSFNITPGTLQNNVKNLKCKVIEDLITFTKYAEELFKTSVEKMCNLGFILDILDLWIMVAAYLKRQKRVINKITNNTPGDNWASVFMNPITSLTELQPT